MKVPNKTLLNIYKLGIINKIEINYELETCDTAETYIIISNKDNQSLKGKLDVYKKYIDLKLGYNSIVKIKDEYLIQIEEYNRLKKENKKDYEEYVRLKNKLGLKD